MCFMLQEQRKELEKLLQKRSLTQVLQDGVYKSLSVFYVTGTKKGARQTVTRKDH